MSAGILDAVPLWLAEQQDCMKSDLVALANQNSGSDNLPGLLAVAQWLEDWFWPDLKDVGFQRVAIPPRKSVNSQGEVEQTETGPILRWDFQPQAERRVLLMIHYDTVFGVDHALQACQDIKEDKLGGPGVADAKGGIVVIRSALQALHQNGWQPDIGWTVILNPDEEVGSLSSTGYMAEVANEFDFGLLFEPSLPSGELVSNRKGSGNFDLVVRGKAAHAGRHFADGRNAVALLSRILVQLDDLNGQREGTTINVGAVQGGGPVNIVPDLAIGRFNARVFDQESQQWFEGKLQQIIEAANQEEALSVELHGGVTSPPKQLTPEIENLMRAIESVYSEQLGNQLSWRATGGVCDGNKLAAAGLPNIDTLGPVGDGLHSSQEWVQPSSLVEKARVIASILERFDRGEFEELARAR
ncbi:MAG: hydrolase [Planctomycetota bacterium]